MPQFLASLVPDGPGLFPKWSWKCDLCNAKGRRFYLTRAIAWDQAENHEKTPKHLQNEKRVAE